MIPNSIIQKIKKAFERHIADNPDEDFTIPADSRGEFTTLARDLETKRQESVLTPQEREALNRVNDLSEKISAFNTREKSPGSEAPLAGNKIYDLKRKQILEESAEHEPDAGPDITAEEAEDIIENLNQQFEEKVVKQTRRPIRKNEKGRERIVRLGDRWQDDPEAGTNLQDYLTNFRPRQTSEPFSDKDSHFDLAKLVDKKDG